MKLKRRKKSKKFKVCITETLERVIEVTASSEEDAIKKVTGEYKNSKYVLDADDFTGVSFDIFEN